MRPTASPYDTPVGYIGAVICCLLLLGWYGVKVYRWHVDIEAEKAAAQERQARAAEFTRHVNSAFDQAMSGRPHLAAIRAEQEARGIDDEWRDLNRGA